MSEPPDIPEWAARPEGPQSLDRGEQSPDRGEQSPGRGPEDRPGTGPADLAAPGPAAPEAGEPASDVSDHDRSGTLPPGDEAVVAQSVWAHPETGTGAGPAADRGAWARRSEPGSEWVPAPPRRSSVGVAVLAVLLAVALVAGVGIGRSLPRGAAPRGSTGSPGGAGAAGPSGSGSSGSAGGDPSGNRPITGSAAAPPGAAEVASAAGTVMGSVVDLDSSLGYEGLAAAGTGIVIGSRGVVLTNNHVVDGETSLTAVDPSTGRHYRGVVVGYDPASDVAVVDLSGASGLPVAATAPVGARVGEQVVAVGNAGGKGGRPSAGGGNIVALDRSVVASDRAEATSEHLSGLIETSAPVQLGDSGGPLVDAAGSVVGMDTAAAKGSASAARDQGFAIPISTALAIAHRIIAGQGSAAVHVGPTAFLGVRASGSSCDAASVHTSIPGGSGALVCEVVPGSAAASSGLVPGDVITAISGRRVDGPAALTQALVTGFHPGEVVSVDYEPGGTKAAAREARVELGSGPPA